MWVFFFFPLTFLYITSQTTQALAGKTDKWKENKDGPQPHYSGINTHITLDHLRT